MQAVLFDLDDTLIVEEAFARGNLVAVCTALAGGAGAPVDGPELAVWVAEEARRRWRGSPFIDRCLRLGIASWEGLWSDLTGCHPSLDGLAAWLPEYRRAVWQAALGRISTSAGAGAHTSDRDADARPGDDDWRVPADQFVARQRAGHPPVPDAIALVRQLADSVALGLVTNGPPDIQRHKVRQAGLEGAFRTVVISGDVGVGKPDPGIFTMALDQLGVAPAAAVMVGNSWERDVLGARAAGLRAVWLPERPPEAPPADPGPDVVQASNVQEVASALASWGFR